MSSVIINNKIYADVEHVYIKQAAVITGFTRFKIRLNLTLHENLHEHIDFHPLSENSQANR